ncbi:MAG TPA: pyridoxal-phosphate dependent enzyme [Sediminispirochaeta sp.]|nr:pyridoxal-phosphate dependent enzyme [Sediminispirochaeta sp.]
MEIPRKEKFEQAYKRVTGLGHGTPILTSSTFDEMTGAHLFFKGENFQKAGAFKFRGAVNSVFSLSKEEAPRGVATHSSGNHAQALALAARLRGIPATIVMPETAPRVKVDAVRGYGARIVFCPPTLEDRERYLDQVVEETGAVFIHPSNDLRVIVGQGTAAMELLEQVEELDYVLTPVGGGGLISGTALAVHYFSPETRVIGAEPAAADDAYRSFRAGRILYPENPQTVADGLKTSLGSNTFPIIRKHVQDIVLVEEKEIIGAMKLAWERMKVVIEASAAVPVAALLYDKLPASLVKGKRIGVILSGGNVDLDKLPW